MKRVDLHGSDFLITGVDFTCYLRVLQHLPVLEEVQERGGAFTEPIREFWDELRALISGIESSISESWCRPAALFGERQSNLLELAQRGPDLQGPACGMRVDR